MSRPLPWYYAVNDRPVKIVETADGGSDCLVFDFATGGFVPDRGYFSQVTPGSGRDVDQLTEEEFERLVAWQREDAFKRRRESPITWDYALRDGPGYQAIYMGRTLVMHMNPPPGHPFYTLLVDGEPVEDFDEWPAAWVRPQVATAHATTDETGASSIPLPSIEPSLLREWSEAICRVPSGDLRDLAAAIGLGERFVQKGRDAEIAPPPEGTSRIMLYSHTIGFDYVRIKTAGNTLTLAQIDAHFGEGRWMPRMGPFTPYDLAYHVEVLGAPFTCEVFASFNEEPTAASVVIEVMLRRDRALS